MTAETLFDLYVHQLRDLYDAEGQLIEALPEMAKAAAHDRLREAFEEHLEQTRGHQDRLATILEELGEEPSGESCDAMEGLIAEGDEIIEMEGDESVRDAALIAAAQRVEHYEISGYGTVATFARALGRDDDEQVLRETLDEEYEADDLLTTIAEEVVNQDALSADLPVKGYQDLTASELQDQLGSLGEEDLRKVLDYEQTHKRRKTVIESVNKQLNG